MEVVTIVYEYNGMRYKEIIPIKSSKDRHRAQFKIDDLKHFEIEGHRYINHYTTEIDMEEVEARREAERLDREAIINRADNEVTVYEMKRVTKVDKVESKPVSIVKGDKKEFEISDGIALIICIIVILLVFTSEILVMLITGIVKVGLVFSPLFLLLAILDALDR